MSKLHQLYLKENKVSKLHQLYLKENKASKLHEFLPQGKQSKQVTPVFEETK